MYNYYPEKRNYLIYTLIAIFAFVLGWQATNFGFLGETNVAESGVNDVSDLAHEDVDLSLYWTVWSELERQYFDEELMDREDMVYGSIKGMVDSMGDHYTVFMTPEETDDFTASLDGSLEGIGAELTVEDDKLVIVSPLKNSPAEGAGLLPGDIIFKVEDEFTVDLTLFDAIMKIRGEKGSTVNLTILREGVEVPFVVSIVRDQIDIESVTNETLGGDIAYLSINHFNDKTNDEFSKAISEMILDEPKGIILDVRYNGGGYLDIAVDLLSYLLPSDSVAVEMKERGLAESEIMYTNGSQKVLDVPVVVLVNEGSASASEILAGAIQDHGRGILIGTQTFGKGTVQAVEKFQDGSSIRMTIAKWFTPAGHDVNEVGIEPDIIVKLTEEDLENEYDAQKEAAAKYLREL
jgi:carboxyl-terminal processing protease